MSDIELSRDHPFSAAIDARERELDGLVADLRLAMGEGTDRIGQRYKSPSGSTTGMAVREAALKRNILKKRKALNGLAAKLAPIMLGLHLDEVELGLVLMHRNQAGIAYWRRLADGGVYAGARPFLDMLAYKHGIDATALLSLQEGEIKAVGHYIRSLLDERKQ